jgi:2-polyprenyl-6-methoxyphenol hydroxylase-like FAD-dependent oxidoreductase
VPAGALAAAYNPAMHAVDVAIHGRGAVASSLALALNQQGLRVALSAAAPDTPSTDVRAYALNAASRRLLQQQ